MRSDKDVISGQGQPISFTVRPVTLLDTWVPVTILKKRTLKDSSNICTHTHTWWSKPLSYHSPHQAFGKTNCDRYTPTTHAHAHAPRMHTTLAWLAGVQEWQLCRVLSELDCDWQTLDGWTSGAFLNQRPSLTVTHKPTRAKTDANQWNRYCLASKLNTLGICQTTQCQMTKTVIFIYLLHVKLKCTCDVCVST